MTWRNHLTQQLVFWTVIPTGQAGVNGNQAINGKRYADKLRATCSREIIMTWECSHIPRGSGGGVVDNTLDYQFRGREIDPPLLRSFG